MTTVTLAELLEAAGDSVLAFPGFGTDADVFQFAFSTREQATAACIKLNGVEVEEHGKLSDPEITAEGDVFVLTLQPKNTLTLTLAGRSELQRAIIRSMKKISPGNGVKLSWINGIGRVGSGRWTDSEIERGLVELRNEGLINFGKLPSGVRPEESWWYVVDYQEFQDLRT